jgi:hypothetical protein
MFHKRREVGYWRGGNRLKAFRHRRHCKSEFLYFGACVDAFSVAGIYFAADFPPLIFSRQYIAEIFDRGIVCNAGSDFRLLLSQIQTPSSYHGICRKCTVWAVVGLHTSAV